MTSCLKQEASGTPDSTAGRFILSMSEELMKTLNDYEWIYGRYALLSSTDALYISTMAEKLIKIKALVKQWQDDIDSDIYEVLDEILRIVESQSVDD